MKICQKCGHDNLNSDKFCGQCGSKLIEPKPKNYCPKCKTTTQRNLKFCTECGTKLVVKPSYTKPKTSTLSKPKPQSQHKFSTPHNKEDNIRKISTESYIINLRKNTNVKFNVNYDNSVYISKEENPYSKLTDSELIEKLEIAKNRHADAIKARDISASRYMTEIKAIEKVLSSRHEKSKPEKLKKTLSSRHGTPKSKKPKENTPIKTKKGTNYEDTDYKLFQSLFINSPLETDMLLKEVFGYSHFPEEDNFNIIIKYYGANNLKKAIKNAERRIKEKNNIIKTKPSTTIKRGKKTSKKSSEYSWKICRRCGFKVISTNYSCPKCHGTKFYNHLSEKNKEQNRKNKDSNKVKIKDIKKDNRIKSKKLKNKLKNMPLY